MDLPKINLKELEKLKEENFKERLEFIEKYVQWIKNNKNSKWSKSQKLIID